jgi:DNA-directed RNA polymerase specialized sigma24 family protein
MDRAEWLSIVAEQHDEWVRIVKSFGEKNFAEDIVMESYIALTKYAKPEQIIKDGKVSRGYMYFTLRSLFYQYYNKKKKYKKIRLDDHEQTWQLQHEDNIEEQQAYHKICTMIDDVSEEWHWYDKKMWKLYSQTDMSIRKLADETNISWVSIFNTLKNLKLDIKNKIQEDWDDLKNEDYERI